MTNWTEYTGSDEQIAELRSAKNGVILQFVDVAEVCGIYESPILDFKDIENQLKEDPPLRYRIIPDNPSEGRA